MAAGALAAALRGGAGLGLRVASDPRESLGRVLAELKVLDGAGATLLRLRVESVAKDLEMGTFEARVIASAASEPTTDTGQANGPDCVLRLEREPRAHFLSPAPGPCRVSWGGDTLPPMCVLWPPDGTEPALKYTWRVDQASEGSDGGSRGLLVAVREEKPKPDAWMYLGFLCALPTAGIAACLAVRRALRQPLVETLLAPDLKSPLGCAMELRGCSDVVARGATFSLGLPKDLDLAQRQAALVALVYSFANRTASLPESNPELL